MQIGQLSTKTGFSRDTIRYYEKLGLIRATKKDFENSYKDYTDAVLKRLLAIRKIKDYGFTLMETRRLLELFDGSELDPQRGKRYIIRKLEVIQLKMNELVKTKQLLESIIMDETCEGKCGIGKILEGMVSFLKLG